MVQLYNGDKAKVIWHGVERFQGNDVLVVSVAANGKRFNFHPEVSDGCMSFDFNVDDTMYLGNYTLIAFVLLNGRLRYQCAKFAAFNVGRVLTAGRNNDDREKVITID